MTTFHVSTVELADALADCLLAVGKDQAFPDRVKSVHLEATAGDRHVTLTAGSGFILVRRRIETRSAVRGTATALIFKADASMLVRVLRADRAALLDPVKVRIGPATTGRRSVLTAAGVTIELVDAEPVDYTPYLARAEKATARADMLPINLRFLAPLAKLSAHRRKKPGERARVIMRFQTSPRSKPAPVKHAAVLVRVDIEGDPSTLVIVMPFRPLVMSP